MMVDGVSHIWRRLMLGSIMLSWTVAGRYLSVPKVCGKMIGAMA